MWLLKTRDRANITNGSISLAIYDADLSVVKQTMLSVNNFSTSAIVSTKIVVHDKFNVGLVKVIATMLAKMRSLARDYNSGFICLDISSRH